ncbi:hypothetical protein H7F10_09485 [Acidithiobacillus sp. HP-6]|uniref:hypothetical protein n=1 Tax=unclassified Acidithiobacillus TaxID=2614800 RepID=UPI001879D72C|nr:MULTISPECIES: hypothetical protein [unclassified Acidithiobacillus]MBE7563173.1 hypothetical protein [Acidithiobacillus sp. HP-6]MBE7570229.1 hypothetical protein [Acidithiobacillus sp. HP-2]
MNSFSSNTSLLIYGLYWFLCLLTSYLIVAKTGQTVDKRFPLLLFVIIASVIPLFGPAVILVYAIFLRSVAWRLHEPELEPVKLPPVMRDIRLTTSTVAPGSVAARLRHSRDPRQRLAAVSQIAESQFFNQSQLLRGALSDEAEEVRLLAYAALDRREQENTELLIHLNAQQTHAHEAGTLRRIQDSRQWLYWNIHHTEAREMATPSSAGAPTKWEPDYANMDHDSPSMKLLMGLHLLETGKVDKAISEMKNAEAKKIASSIVAPHLASAYFRSRNIDKMFDIYRAHPELKLSPRYGPSFSFWTGGKP